MNLKMVWLKEYQLKLQLLQALQVMHGNCWNIQSNLSGVDQNAGGNPINAEPAGRTAYTSNGFDPGFGMATNLLPSLVTQVFECYPPQYPMVRIQIYLVSFGLKA